MPRPSILVMRLLAVVAALVVVASSRAEDEPKTSRRNLLDTPKSSSK